jgi:hypothetical protein
LTTRCAAADAGRAIFGDALTRDFGRFDPGQDRADALMRAFDREHPGYGFAQHMGYATPEHLDCLQRLGPCLLHRRSFAPVRGLIPKPADDHHFADNPLVRRLKRLAGSAMPRWADADRRRAPAAGRTVVEDRAAHLVLRAATRLLKR